MKQSVYEPNCRDCVAANLCEFVSMNFARFISWCYVVTLRIAPWFQDILGVESKRTRMVVVSGKPMVVIVRTRANINFRKPHYHVNVIFGLILAHQATTPAFLLSSSLNRRQSIVHPPPLQAMELPQPGRCCLVSRPGPSRPCYQDHEENGQWWALGSSWSARQRKLSRTFTKWKGAGSGCWRICRVDFYITKSSKSNASPWPFGETMCTN